MRDSGLIATGSREGPLSTVQESTTTGGLISESLGCHQDEPCTSELSNSAHALGIMLNDSDRLLPSSRSPFHLDLQGEIIPTSNAVSELHFGNGGFRIMEQVVSSQSLAFESESSLGNMENRSPAVLDDKGEQSNEEEQKTIKPTSKEFKKTWGFRRTTIAKREGAGDVDVDTHEQQPQQQQSLSLRRSGRQPKRTERVEEFLTTVRRRGRKSVPTALEDSSEPASCPVTDVETASEGSVESTPDIKTGTQKSDSKDNKGHSVLKSRGADDDDDDDDTSDSDSDGLTLKELQNRLRNKRIEQKPEELTLKEIQNRLRKKHLEQNPTETVDVQAGNEIKTELPVKQEPESTDSIESGSQVVVSEEHTEDLQVKKEIKPALETKEMKGEESEEFTKSKSESEIYDPNTLYCICHQPHNNRFMICCDRCEEWFHGDCVGISEARGRLLERNGEDYICPNCTILQGQDETVSETDQQDTKLRQVNMDGTELTSIGTVEQKSIEDQGIKGRIEKAANPSGKKKLKIFQPVIEAPGASKCIGPGCSNVAQPDSVYCSNDCILKHAAATMKFLSAGKEPKPKEKIKSKSERSTVLKSQVQTGTKPLSTQKRLTPEKREINMKKSMVTATKTEANTQPVAKEPASENSTPSWASDHNYNAVKPEKTAAISSSLLFKSQKEEKKSEDKPVEPVTASKKGVVSASTVEKQMSSLSKTVGPKKSPSFTSTSLTKHPTKYSAAGFKGVIPKKSWLSSGNVPSSKQSPLSHGSPSVSRKSPVSSNLAGGLRKTATSSTSVSTTSAITQIKGAANPQSQPNSQIRQNIRRSLKEILWKRVNDSDDLIMTESEVGKIALNIEKEMFNLFQVTDNRYKSKYRSIMFNLKDPKNQGLFHRVLREEISLSKLVRMKPEELLSKELSVWKEKPIKSIPESRSKSHESKKSAIKQENIPDVNMEDSPPVSDSDEQQESARDAPEKSSAPLLDIFSSMLKDTTSQHRAHLFDLNCKICTGQVSAYDDEPTPKKSKLSVTSSKKTETQSKPEVKPKYESSTPTTEPETEAVSENTTETFGSVTETLSQSVLETTYFPTTQGHNNAESTLPEEVSIYPTSCIAGVVTTVTVSGRDPRTAMSNSSGIVTSTSHSSPAPDKVSMGESKQEISKSVLTTPKSILTKPSSSPDPRYLTVPPSPNINITESRSPQDGDTSFFLSRLNTIWKGFINMQSVAKFVTKAYPVSGCFEYLSEDLPDTIHIGGRISPKTVWDYVGKLKSSLSKELCLIRFHPATEEEEVAYISLYSYFSSRGRFGVVANNNRHVKDLYLIPLSAKDPIPSKLLPFEGPGLESSRPNLILGLVICQKGKRPATVLESDKMEEKRSRIQIQEENEVSVYPKGPLASQQEKKLPKYTLYTGDTAVGTTPPGSPPPPPPPPPPLPIQEPSPMTPSVLKILSSIKTGTTTTMTLPVPTSATVTGTTTSSPTTSKTATPLEHILQTLFGKKKTFDSVTKDPETVQSSNQEAQLTIDGGSAAPLLDPIVQQFGQMSKDKVIEEEEDDRPYDPEEEYEPDGGFEIHTGESEKLYDLEKPCETSEQEDEAYDPEDETILEEAKVTVDDLPNKMYTDVKSNTVETSAPYVSDLPASSSLVEQQKMLEELNKQIEEQKRQLEEQEEALRQQRAAVGVSMAHFSVSDALMSPPPKSSITKTDLFQQEQQTTEKSDIPSSSNQQAQVLNQSSDLRQSRDPRQARRMVMENNDSADSRIKPQIVHNETLTKEVLPLSYPGSLQTSLDKEDKTLISATPTGYSEDKWVPSEKVATVSEQGASNIKMENTAKVHLENVNQTASGETSTAKPIRKVLLPTPPSTSFQRNFPIPNDGQSLQDLHKVPWSNESQDINSPSVERDSFSNPNFTAQEKTVGHFEPERSLSSVQYEDQRNSQSRQFAEQTESPAVQSEGERGPQHFEENRGGPPFPLSGQKGGVPPLMFGTSVGPHGPNYLGQRGPAPQFSEEHGSAPNNDGERGPPPGRFGGQKGNIPSLFSTQHGPSPLFGDNRGPSSSYLGGPRGMSPSQFEDRREPHMEQRDFPDSQYNEMIRPPGQFEGPEPPQFMGNRGPSPFHFGGQRRPPPSQFKGQRGGPPPPQFGGPRGPPPSHFGGSRSPHPNQFEGQRGPAPSHMPGPRGLLPQPFEERRGSPPPRFANQRGPAPLHFGGPRGTTPAFLPEQNEPPPRFHFQGQPPQQGMKPTPRPLLELPSHPPTHRKEMWDEAGPSASLSNLSGQGPESEAQWPASDFREGKNVEFRGQTFEGRQRERYEGGNKEKVLDQPEGQQSENRQGRGFEDRRRDREHGRPWERDQGRNWSRDRERDWERQRDKDWDKNRDRNQNKDREKDSERAKEWERNRDRERARTRERDSYRRRDRDRSRSRDRDRDRDRSREKERDRERDRDRDRGRDRKDRSKSKESGKDLKPEPQKETQKPAETEVASFSTNQT
ncbi:death-inducer obliterator 1 isoform X3 [Pelodiscus sinensis]|uniref:death-inducer obliterator 1 isoform X3 n=1 Tax=Pelodiscus sinensis TaxID=13735 RepID=UPI003F6B2625